MNILKNGKYLWTSKDFSCPICGCIFEASFDDQEVTAFQIITPSGEEVNFKATCPQCGCVCIETE